jgi:hypothetical protein
MWRLVWQTIKYGVIGTETLLRDVSTWQRLYISGRLQKPVGQRLPKQ